MRQQHRSVSLTIRLSYHLRKFRFGIRPLVYCNIYHSLNGIATGILALGSKLIVGALRCAALSYSHRCAERELIIAAGSIEDVSFSISHRLLG